MGNGTPEDNAFLMGRIQQQLENIYKLIYRVPNNIWAKIAPKPKTLGEHTEHYFGGILCPECAAQRALDIGITLHFIAEEWNDDI